MAAPGPYTVSDRFRKVIEMERRSFGETSTFQIIGAIAIGSMGYYVYNYQNQLLGVVIFGVTGIILLKALYLSVIELIEGINLNRARENRKRFVRSVLQQQSYSDPDPTPPESLRDRSPVQRLSEVVRSRKPPQ